MKVQLMKLAAILCTSLVALPAIAQAKWPISKKIDMNTGSTQVNVVKTQPHVVQVFSSINATKAEGMKNTLEMQGYPAFISIGKKRQRQHYQVQIGPFISRNIAYKAKKSIVQRYPQFPFLSEAILKVSFQN